MEVDKPYAQPVSGVLNNTGIAKKLTRLEVSILNCAFNKIEEQKTTIKKSKRKL